MSTNPKPANPANRHALIEDWLAMSKALDFTVQQGYPAGLIDYVPPVQDAWSIRAHLVHVLDADIMLHGRLRFSIAEPGMTVPVWDEEAWHSSLGYEKQNATATVSLFRMLRALTAELLKGLSDEAWRSSWAVHSVKGPMNIEDWLVLYNNHVRGHLDYIARNEKAWKEAGNEGGGCCGA